jgi:hypothetical protein
MSGPRCELACHIGSSVETGVSFQMNISFMRKTRLLQCEKNYHCTGPLRIAACPYATGSPCEFRSSFGHRWTLRLETGAKRPQGRYV